VRWDSHRLEETVDDLPGGARRGVDDIDLPEAVIARVMVDVDHVGDALDQSGPVSKAVDVAQSKVKRRSRAVARR